MQASRQSLFLGQRLGSEYRIRSGKVIVGIVCWRLGLKLANAGMH